MMLEIGKERLAKLLFKPSAHISPMQMRRRGFYRAFNDDIILITPFFVVRIKNVKIKDLPVDSFYSIAFQEQKQGDPSEFYEMPLDFYTRLLEVPDKLILSEVHFSYDEFLEKMATMTDAEVANARIVFSELHVPKNMRLMKFTCKAPNGKPAIQIGQNYLTASEFEAKDGTEIVLGRSYLVGEFHMKNGEPVVEVLRQRAEAEAGFLISRGVWLPDPDLFTTAHFPPNYTVPATKYVNKLPNSKYSFCFHADASMFLDLLEIFRITNVQSFHLDIPIPEIHPVSIFNGRKGGDMLLDRKDGKIATPETVRKSQTIPGDVCKEPLIAVLKMDDPKEGEPQVEIAFAGLCYSASGPQGR